MANDRRRFAPLAATLLALAGLAASTAMLVDAVRPEPAFCALEGCAAVRDSAWSRPLGIPMPIFGMAFFAAALALTGAGADRARRLLAVAGAAGAIGLIALQGLVIGEWCAMCVAVDTIAIALAALMLTGRARPWPRAGGRRVALTAAIAVAAIALPFARTRPDDHMVTAVARSGGLPEVAREQVPGVAVVVDFIDFECPHCRAMHETLDEALAQIDAPVRVVRKMVPLPNHRGAMPAAIAWRCAEIQGKGAEMAAALLTAPVGELTPEGCARLAAMLGLDLARYQADAAHPDTRRSIDADLADAREAGVRSLPTIYIGEQAFIGAGASAEELVAALRRAAA
jgi:uncharacterized membrane protein/protein-disulfide isomerase